MRILLSQKRPGARLRRLICPTVNWLYLWIDSSASKKDSFAEHAVFANDSGRDWQLMQVRSRTRCKLKKKALRHCLQQSRLEKATIWQHLCSRPGKLDISCVLTTYFQFDWHFILPYAIQMIMPFFQFGFHRTGRDGIFFGHIRPFFTSCYWWGWFNDYIFGCLHW